MDENSETSMAALHTDHLIRLWAEMGVEIGAVTPEEDGTWWPGMPQRAVEGGRIHYVWMIVEGDSNLDDDGEVEGDCETKFYLACSEQEMWQWGIIESSADATCPKCRAKGKPPAGPWWPAPTPATPRKLDFTNIA